MPDSKQPTAPPPFDPEEFARSSESTMPVASDSKLTTEQPAPPPLNRRVRLAVPEADLAWFEISLEAQALIARIDGTLTLLELMELVPSTDSLRAVTELFDAKLLAFEDKT